MLKREVWQELISEAGSQDVTFSSERERQRNSESYRNIILSEAKKLQERQQKRTEQLLRQSRGNVR